MADRPGRPRATHQRSDLSRIAHQAMLDKGLLPDFDTATTQQVQALQGPAPAAGDGVRDLTRLLWCSIDNDDSRDLDQLTVADDLGGGKVRILVAIADVDALVTKGSAADTHAQHNTTSVYTEGGIFPMLPERLSTDLTSLADQQTRLSVVVDMVIADGVVQEETLYRAAVHNQAKLAYDSVAAWLEGGSDGGTPGPLPPAAAKVPGMDAQLRLQDGVAQRLRELRHEQGALTLETIEPRAVFDGEQVTDLRSERTNRAKQLIEDFMIAANGVTARFLAKSGFASLRRVVRSPERWQRIVKVAQEKGATLPAEPDAKALETFLQQQRQRDPVRFPDLSLVIVKLMGAGEYAVDYPNQEEPGHFGLAVRDYTHSTAPNRRYPDVITQRQVKAALTGKPSPYATAELEGLAQHCTEMEDAANRVERQVRKSAAALLLERRIGERFDGVVTGANDKGVWVRVFHPPVEGKVERGAQGLEVGEKVRVELLSTDVERGFIDFARVG